MDVRVHKKEDLSDALLVVGFPSRGLVGGIAVNYVIDQLKMWHFASLSDPRLPPTVVVRGGVAYSPIQLFVGDETCGVDGTCDKLVACLSEMPIEAPLLADAAGALLEWAKKEGISHVAVLEGMETTSGPKVGNGKQKAAAPVVRAVRSISSRIPKNKFGRPPDDETIISSYASAFLLAANDLDVDLIAYYVEARQNMPDASAAAHLLQAVDAMLPNIDFTYAPLEQRAQRIEAAMKNSMRENTDQLSKLRRATEMMFQ